MWYFAWVLGIGFAVLLAILNALWGENEDAREEAREQARADALRQAHADVDPARANGKAAH
ncbi:MAG: cytochrome bd-I oxidase subunit CydX [Zoogloeaceae bacterium]|uniref:cytochrome bd-I oxidase subunit CydX n=1 Tax=Thauera sp. JM12B12 TaxID=3142262 RepID=UPI0029C4B2B8|nr:cytochrome bd-I oxidase subunit CydX [Zoogloeaceae bacterium]